MKAQHSTVSVGAQSSPSIEFFYFCLNSFCQIEFRMKKHTVMTPTLSNINGCLKLAAGMTPVLFKEIKTQEKKKSSDISDIK